MGGQGIKISSSRWMTLASHGQCACAVSQAAQGQKAVGWPRGDKLSIENTLVLRAMSCRGAGRLSVHSQCVAKYQPFIHGEPKWREPLTSTSSKSHRVVWDPTPSLYPATLSAKSRRDLFRQPGYSFGLLDLKSGSVSPLTWPFFKIVWLFRDPLYCHMTFRVSLLPKWEKDFSRRCVKFVDRFEEYCHLNNIVFHSTNARYRSIYSL